MLDRRVAGEARGGGSGRRVRVVSNSCGHACGATPEKAYCTEPESPRSVERNVHRVFDTEGRMSAGSFLYTTLEAADLYVSGGR